MVKVSRKQRGYKTEDKSLSLQGQKTTREMRVIKSGHEFNEETGQETAALMCKGHMAPL